MPAKNTQVRCPECHGKGSVDLPLHLEETIAYIRKNKCCSVQQIHKDIGKRMTVNALNNRVADLFNMGLLERFREGKTYFYTARKSR